MVIYMVIYSTFFYEILWNIISIYYNFAFSVINNKTIWNGHAKKS